VGSGETFESAEPNCVNRVVLVIPVKSFALAKQRLSSVLTTSQRATLGRQLATRVVEANRFLRPMIVSDDDEVARWASDLNLRFVRQEESGLNQAVAIAFATLRAENTEMAVIAHSDLATASSLQWVAEFNGITIVPDRRNEGTNVLAIPTKHDFDFTYGVGSFGRHYRTALSTGSNVRVVADRLAGVDLDSPADLRLLR
jgi:2-phospho-L-lactate/phosphoenolpyruvate guanylyltransferase